MGKTLTTIGIILIILAVLAAAYAVYLLIIVPKLLKKSRAQRKASAAPKHTKAKEVSEDYGDDYTDISNYSKKK